MQDVYAINHRTIASPCKFGRVIQFSGIEKLVRLITDNASNNLAAFNRIVLAGFDDVLDEISGSEDSG